MLQFVTLALRESIPLQDQLYVFHVLPTFSPKSQARALVALAILSITLFLAPLHVFLPLLAISWTILSQVKSAQAVQFALVGTKLLAPLRTFGSTGPIVCSVGLCINVKVELALAQSL